MPGYTEEELCPLCSSPKSHPVKLGVYGLLPEKHGLHAQIMIEFRVCEVDGVMWVPKSYRGALLEGGEDAG